MLYPYPCAFCFFGANVVSQLSRRLIDYYHRKVKYIVNHAKQSFELVFFPS